MWRISKNNNCCHQDCGFYILITHVNIVSVHVGFLLETTASTWATGSLFLMASWPCSPPSGASADTHTDHTTCDHTAVLTTPSVNTGGGLKLLRTWRPECWLAKQTEKCTFRTNARMATLWNLEKTKELNLEFCSWWLVFITLSPAGPHKAVAWISACSILSEPLCWCMRPLWPQASCKHTHFFNLFNQ